MRPEEPPRELPVLVCEGCGIELPIPVNQPCPSCGSYSFVAAPASRFRIGPAAVDPDAALEVVSEPELGGAYDRGNPHPDRSGVGLDEWPSARPRQIVVAHDYERGLAYAADAGSGRRLLVLGPAVRPTSEVLAAAAADVLVWEHFAAEYATPEDIREHAADFARLRAALCAPWDADG